MASTAEVISAVVNWAASWRLRLALGLVLCGGEGTKGSSVPSGRAKAMPSSALAPTLSGGLCGVMAPTVSFPTGEGAVCERGGTGQSATPGTLPALSRPATVRAGSDSVPKTGPRLVAQPLRDDLGQITHTPFWGSLWGLELRSGQFWACAGEG